MTELHSDQSNKYIADDKERMNEQKRELPKSLIDIENQLKMNKSPYQSKSKRVTPQNLQWTNITFNVGKIKILTDCWGEVPAGTVCAIMGPSGAGKVRSKIIILV